MLLLVKCPKGERCLYMDHCLIMSYGFMTIICPYMGIPRYGLNIDDMGNLIYGNKAQLCA